VVDAGGTRPRQRGRDWFVDVTDGIRRAVVNLHEALARNVEMLDLGEREWCDGVPLPTIVKDVADAGGREARRGVDEAFARYERAVMTFRSSVVRALVHGDGLSLSEVGRRLGISRQMATRLYALRTHNFALERPDT
jgi:hypothetical protein